MHRALRLKSAEADKYRIRQGNYRILYEIIDYELIVTVVRIGDRREISRRSTSAELGSVLLGVRNEFDQIARLAVQCLANGLERGETDGACLASLQNRQVGKRDTDSFRQLG